MIWLLTLGCSDKDNSDDTGSTTDTGSAEVSCALGALAPLTVPIETDNELTTTLSCTGEFTLSAVTLDGVDVAFDQQGDLVKVRPFNPRSSGRYTLTFWIQPRGSSPPISIEGEVRAHTEPELSPPDNLLRLGGGDLVAMGEATFVMVDGSDLVILDGDAKETSRFPHKWPFNERTCQTEGSILVCGDAAGEETDTTIGWVDLEKSEPATFTYEGALEHFKPGTKSPNVVVRTPVEAGPNNTGSGGIVVYHQDYSDPFEMGDLKGDVRLLDLTVLHATCTKDDTVLLTELSVEGNKEKSSTELAVPCAYDDWQLSSGDFDQDGDLDELHVFSVGGEVYVKTRENLGNNAFIGGGDLTLSDSSVVDIRDGSAMTVSSGEVFSVGWGDPSAVYRGIISGKANLLAGARSTGFQDPTGSWWVAERGGPWELAVGSGGESLTRTTSADGVSFALDGAPVKGLPGASFTGVYDGHVVSITTEDLLIDEREMSTGADWDLVQPVGIAHDGLLWIARGSKELGVGLTLIDLDDPDGAEKALQGLPIFVAKLHPDTSSEDLLSIGGISPPLGTEDPNVAPSLVALVETEEGCGLAVLNGSSPDLDDIEIIEEAATCEELGLPMATGDYLGNGGTQTVLTTGRLLGQDTLSCKLVFGPPDDQYRTAPGGGGGGDVNGDEFDDLFVERDGETVLLLSQGNGSWTAYEDDWAWIEVASLPGAAPGLARPPSVILPLSWASMLD